MSVKDQRKKRPPFERWAQLARLISVIVALVSLFVAIASGVLQFVRLASPPTTSTLVLPNDLSVIQTELVDIRTELNTLSGEVTNLGLRVDALLQVPPDAAINSELTQIRSDLDSVSTSLEGIEEVILEDPAKALSLMLLDQEMENLQQRYEADLQAVREEMGRAYSQNNWFIGLIFTMAIALLTLAVSNFLPRRGRQDSEE